MAPSSMVIDGHAHAAREYSTSVALTRSLDINEIDRVVLCPTLKNVVDLRDPPKVFRPRADLEPHRQFLSNRLIRMT
jgi:hypothetical protein